MLSVVIPTYKRFDRVKTLCDILKPIECVGEILLIGSEEVDCQELGLLIGGKIRYLLAIENSVALKRNIGARESIFDYICFLDDDVIVDRTSIECLNALLQTGKRAIYCGNVNYRYHTSKGIDHFLRYRNSRAELGAKSTNSWKNFVSMYFGCTKKVFNMLGGFDESIKGYGAEEYSFALSAQKKLFQLNLVKMCMAIMMKLIPL